MELAKKLLEAVKSNKSAIEIQELISQGAKGHIDQVKIVNTYKFKKS